MASKIIRKLAKNDFINILDDIQNLLSSDEKFDCIKICRVLRALYQTVAPSSADADAQQTVFDLLPCINLCIDHAIQSFTCPDLNENQFFNVFYHLIRAFLKVELYQASLSSGSILKNLLADPSYDFEKKSTHTHNLGISFWNEAYQLETKSKLPDPKTSFELRKLGIEFLLLHTENVDAVTEKININLRIYCQKCYQTNMEEIIEYIKNMWSHLVNHGSGYCHHAFLYTTLCSWFGIIYKHSNEISCIGLFLTLLDDIKNYPKRNEKNVLKICSGISELCIQFFLSQEYEKKNKKSLLQHIEYCRNCKKWTDIDIKILSETCQIIYICFAKYFNAMKNFDFDNSLQVVASDFESCILFVQYCIEMGSKVEMLETSPITPSIKVFICHNIVNLFIGLFKRDQTHSQKEILIKESKAFVQFSKSNLSCSMNAEDLSKTVIAYGVCITCLGFSVYNADFVSESIDYLEASEFFMTNFPSSEEYNSDKVQHTLWKMRERLVFAYFLSGQYIKSLSVVARLLTLYRNKSKECFDLWRKVKKEALRNDAKSALSKTITDMWLLLDIHPDPEQEISILLEEFKACKSDKTIFEAVAESVVLNLLSLNLPKSTKAFILLEVITMPESVAEKICSSLKKSLPELSLEATSLYSDHLTENPNDDSAKLYMSLVYFHLYHENTRKLHEIAEKETQNLFRSLAPKPKQSIAADEVEENEVCDIQPTHPLVCLSIEEENLKNLDLAMQLWWGISDWKVLATIVKEKYVLDIIQATAETYALAACDSSELKLWLLLQKASNELDSRLHEHTAYISLTHVVIRLGYMNMASYFLKMADCTCKKLSSIEMEASELKLQLARSNYLLHTGKFDEGLQLVNDVLGNPSMEKKFKSFKMLNVEALLLLSEYLFLPTKAYTCDASVKFLKDNFYLAPIMESVSLAKSILKLLSEKSGSVNNFEWLCFKPLLLKNLQKAHLFLGEMYFKAGEPRSARCYLQEALKIAESHIFTYWSSKALILLGQIDLMCENFKDCQVKANGLRYILGKEKRNTIDILTELQAKQTSPLANNPLSPDSPSDLIIYTAPDMTVTRKIKQAFIDKIDVMASPVSKRLAKKQTDKINSPYLTGEDFSKSLVRLEYLFLLSLLPQSESLTSKKQLTVWQELIDGCNELKNPDLLRSVLASVKFAEGHVKGALSRVRSKEETLLFTDIVLQVVQLHCTKNESSKAREVLASAYAFLKESSHCPSFCYPDVYSHLRYHDIRISLCEHLKILPNSSVSYHLCPSVKPNAPSRKKVLEKSLAENALSTPVSKNLPKITITKARKCRAPLKKSVLNTNLKKDIDLLTVKSLQSCSPFLIFSSSDEGENFESPYSSLDRASKSKAASKKKPKTGKKSVMENCDSDLRYQFFKSKNAALGVKSSSDVWSLALADTPKNSKSDQHKQLNYHLSEGKLDVECARSSPIGSTRRKKLTSKNSNKIGLNFKISEDFENDSVFFSPSSRVIPDLVEILCNDLKTLTLSETKQPAVITEENLKDIIQELNDVRGLIHTSMPFPLYANVCKLLAVLTLIQSAALKRDQVLRCSFLLSETFSISLRNLHIANMMYLKNPDFVSEKDALLTSLCQSETDINLHMETFLLSLPQNWIVVQVSALHNNEYFDASNPIPCSTKLIICRYQRSREPLVITTDSSMDETVSSNLLAEFEAILRESALTMLHKDLMLWWNTRLSLNTRLKDLVKCMENVWLGCWKGVFLGEPQDEERVERLQSSVDEICQASPCSKALLQILIDSAKHLSDDQISAAVSYLWNFSLDEESHKNMCRVLKRISVSLPETDRHHVILILDQSIQALPWECIPILSKSSVSRMPSLSILQIKLNRLSPADSMLNRGLDSTSTYYLLNPGGDLVQSQEYFQRRFRKQKKWNGKIGIPPSVKEYVSAFKDHDLFIYCGHGSGRQYFESKCVDKMRLQAATLLMGCSSGRLRRLGKVLEAYGIVLKLLLSGCPSITANLWDITDKDIDRFTDRFLQSVLPDFPDAEGFSTSNRSKYDVAQAVALARSACKLQYLVGAAPVVYGFPVFAYK